MDAAKRGWHIMTIPANKRSEQVQIVSLQTAQSTYLPRS
ncbi:hypothetical protein SynSYN20_03324 [Synechococcus sp. SYN20]|nr:hypothetical protein SynSYN20_03324 [Synechococcus sp. SYN20]